MFIIMVEPMGILLVILAYPLWDVRILIEWLTMLTDKDF